MWIGIFVGSDVGVAVDCLGVYKGIWLDFFERILDAVYKWVFEESKDMV